MNSQLTVDAAALRLFFTDDIYMVNYTDSQYDTSAVGSGTIAGVGGNPVSGPIPSIPLIKPQITALAAEPATSSVQQPVEFKFLGKNKRNILILVNDEHNEVSDESGRELLRKIVKSVNLSANDFALLNYAGCKGTGFKQLQEYFSCALVFAFGVSPAELSLPAHPEHSVVSEGGVRMIFSAELRVLDQNAAGKKALWGSLQSLGL